MASRAEGMKTTPAEAAAASTSPPWPVEVIWPEWPDVGQAATGWGAAPGVGPVVTGSGDTAGPATGPRPAGRAATRKSRGDERRTRRAQQLLERVGAQVGVPVMAALPVAVEGTYGWVLLGLAIGVGLIQGALGALIGIAVGYGVGRLATRHRAVGLPTRSVLAVSPDAARAVKVGWWSGRPTGEVVAVWPVGLMRAEVRRKLCTVAVRLVGPDGRALRLECQGRQMLAACESFAGQLSGSTSAEPPVVGGGWSRP
jgi:hypothetical protein